MGVFVWVVVKMSSVLSSNRVESEEERREYAFHLLPLLYVVFDLGKDIPYVALTAYLNPLCGFMCVFVINYDFTTDGTMNRLYEREGTIYCFDQILCHLVDFSSGFCGPCGSSVRNIYCLGRRLFM